MYRQEKTYKLISSSDIAMLLFAAVVLMVYPYGENLAPEFLRFFVLMVLLWFTQKVLYQLLPQLKAFILIGLLVWGVIEAFWGLGQLYGCFPAKHSLFRTTGSFFNSGPYGGFLPLMLPLLLHAWIVYRSRNKILEYVILAVSIVFLLVFPATLSRTGWISAITGCLSVLFFSTNGSSKLKGFNKRHLQKVFLLATIIAVFLMGGIYGIFHLKKDSANGRLFMWKITALAIRESPLQGVGLGGFSAAYAKAQMDYFKSGKGSETERKVAGSPEYAFNEYLRVFLEQGVSGGILFLLLTALIIRNGIQNRQTGAVGSFLALSVFAFASYPYYLWQFLIVWVVLGSVCTSAIQEERRDKIARRHARLSVLFLIVLFGGTWVILKQLQLYRQARKEWDKIQPLYTMKAYESIGKEYEKLYATLNHSQKFVFEYAVVLNAAKQYGKADSVLARGLQLSSDPMFYNVRGRNFHEMKKYKEAEVCYFNSIHLLPERIYPYYLLAKLYADSANFQPEKMKQAARAVLEKEPKVHSTAIREMRNEVRKMVKSKEVGNER